MSLPILSFQQQIIEAVVQNPVVIITGEPGCGKSTQIPQFCVDSRSLRKKLHCSDLKLAITQPRRVAAISMAKRVAFERRCRLGEEVGYSIRFEDITSKRTQIKYLTDGVLLRESMTDCFCNYDVIILDEAHERSLETDILLGLLKSHSSKHRHFRLIITSATLNVSLFSAYFSCPVITIPGRQFSIETLHSSCKLDRRVEYTVNAAIRIHLHEGPGDILAFLTGSDECERAKSKCFEALRDLSSTTEVPSMLILSLYGAMTSDEQSKVFKKTPENCRKVIFSTNISETSITVDGIGFVIDCGYVKQKQFNPKTGLEALVVVPISRQQAQQRAGRAGRTQDGKCFRLYSEGFYNDQMLEYHEAEIFRSNLASVLLTLKSIGIRNIQGFEFLESPSEEAITNAVKDLFLIGAIDAAGYITPLGREISKFPLDPRFGRCLVSSIILDCADDIIELLAVLSSENIWRSVPKNESFQIEELRKSQYSFMRPDGDHLTILKMFQEWLKNNKSRRWCDENYISSRGMAQANEIKHQLKDIIKTVKVPRLIEDELIPNFKEQLQTTEQRVRFTLCTGFYMNAARRIELGQEGSYLSVKDSTMLHADKLTAFSVLSQYPKWIVYTQLSGTNLVHGTMKCVSKVKGKWLKPLVPLLDAIDIDKLLGKTSVKRPAETDLEPTPTENVEAKIQKAKERYLKRKQGKID